MVPVKTPIMLLFLVPESVKPLKGTGPYVVKPGENSPTLAELKVSTLVLPPPAAACHEAEVVYVTTAANPTVGSVRRPRILAIANEVEMRDRMVDQPYVRDGSCV
jgi:hypothetical protein